MKWSKWFVRIDSQPTTNHAGDCSVREFERKNGGFVGPEMVVLLMLLAGLGSLAHAGWGVYEDLRLRWTMWDYRAIGEPMEPRDMRGLILKDPENAVIDMRAAATLMDDEGDRKS